MSFRKSLEISLRRFFIRNDGLKKLIERTFIRFGFNVIPGKSGLKLIRFDEPAPYLPNYSPWMEPAFLAYFDGLAEYTTTRPANLWTLQALVRQTEAVDGEVWQIGVYRGGGAKAIEDTLSERTGMKPVLRLFDTFEGLVGTTPGKDYYEDGMLGDTNLELVQSLMSSDSTHIYAGAAPAVLEEAGDGKLAFVQVDIDAYYPTLETLRFVHGRIAKGGILVVETYGLPNGRSVRAATDVFSREVGATVLVLSTAQGVIFYN
jgi:hypothetical protein